MLAAAVFTALSLATPFAGVQAPQRVPDVTVATHGVRVTFQPKLCPKTGGCTLEAPFVGRRLPVHRGGRLIVRTQRSVLSVRLLYFRPYGRLYAPGQRNAAGTVWTFRVPETERFGFSLVGWRELQLDIDYGEATGFMGLYLAEHQHRRFTPPLVSVGDGHALARPRFCTWLVFDPFVEGRDACGHARGSQQPVRLTAIPGSRVVVRFRAPVVWTELYRGEGEWAPEYAPLRREDASGSTWSFRVRASESRTQRLKLEIAYPQGFGTLLLELTPHL